MIDPITFVKLYSLFNLGLAIAEAVILDRTTDAQHECAPQIWICILVSCIVRFLTSGVTLVVDREVVNDRIHTKISLATNLVHFLGIWSVWLFHTVGGDCKHIFQAEYPDLWRLIEAEAISFYIVCGVCILGLVYRRYVADNQPSYESG